MSELNDVNDTLSNPITREEYDNYIFVNEQEDYYKDQWDNGYDYEVDFDYYMHFEYDIYLNEDVKNEISLDLHDPITGESFSIKLPLWLNLGETKLRIRNRGLFINKSDDSRGNLYLIINVVEDEIIAEKPKEENTIIILKEDNGFVSWLSDNYWWIIMIILLAWIW